MCNDFMTLELFSSESCASTGLVIDTLLPWRGDIDWK